MHWAALIGIGIGASALSGCTQPSAGANPADPSASPEPTERETSEKSASTAEGDKLTSWVKALEVHRYRDAAALFDAEHPKPDTPALRFVRARIAVEVEDHGRAVGLLQDLETELSAFEHEIETLRAEAQFVAGPFEAAADFYARDKHARSQLKAARAYRRAGKEKRALRAVEAGLKRAEKASRAQELLSELLREKAELLEAGGQRALAIKLYQRLLSSLPTRRGADGADDAYERLSKTKLARLERYQRAEAFTDDGNFERAQRELRLMDEAPGPAPPGADVLRTRAWSYYKSRKDYAQAAKLFTQTAKLDPKYRTQDLFFAARALSRSNQDEAAIDGYLALAKRSPKSSYAEQARYLAARLYFLLGRFKEAALAYDDYERRYKQGRYIDEARYQRALVRLALSDGKAALSDLERSLRRAGGDDERAALQHLVGLALLQAEKEEQAVDAWRKVIAQRPLSFAALVSTARLTAMGAEAPSPILASEGTASLGNIDIALPPKVDKLVGWGLHRDAERELYGGRRAFSSRYGSRGEEAVCEALGLLSTAERRYGYAHYVVPERVLMRAVTGETRWQWDCIYPRPYSLEVRAREDEYRVQGGLVYAIMRQESAFRPEVVSPVGAVGLMQLMPTTAEKASAEIGAEYDESLLRSPPYNIELGAFYIGKMLERFEGSVPIAAAAYNAGPNAVSRWLQYGSDLPLDIWVARIPYNETRGYVRRVVGNWARYRYLEGGAEAVPALTLGLPRVDAPRADDY